MERVFLRGTDDTPEVLLDKANNQLVMSGRSLPEDVAAFYDPILEWMEEYSEAPNPKTIFDFKLSYFNTASSKLILDILMKLEELQQAGSEVLVRWHYPDDDEDMEEAGQEYADIVEIPFEQISYSAD